MKKIIVTSMLFVCSMVLTLAQSTTDISEADFTIGVFGGLNIPQLTGGKGNPLSSNWTTREGVALGFTLNWNVSANFAWRADILYSSEGGQRNGMQAFDAVSFNPQVPAGTYFYANYRNQSILNYLELPVMAKYSVPFGRASSLYVDFGPYVGFLLNATEKTKGSSIVYADAAGTQAISIDPVSGQPVATSFNASTDIKNQINMVNFGLTGGVGFSQQLGFGLVFMDLRGAYGLTPVQHNSKNGNNHIGNLLISWGYSIPL
jgi:hypothetical protein